MEGSVANTQQGMQEFPTRKAIAVCGCGNDGRLGLGSCDSQNRITLIPFFLGGTNSTDTTNSNNNEKKNNHDGNMPGIIQTLRVGGYHNFVITTTGVYGWGLNENGQLGLGRGTAASVLQPTRINFFDEHPVIDISCGAYHTFAWTVDGLFACGKNDEGQLGLSTDSDYMEFTMVLNATQINKNKKEEEEEEEKKKTTINKTTGESLGECRLIKRAQLTHLSCGTHHTLLAFRDVEITAEEEETEIEKETEYEKERRRQHFPLLILATGKGDFGELGYDGDTWSILQAKAKRMQSALQVEIQQHHQQKGLENNTVSDYPELIEKKWKPLKQRRAAFSSTRFQPVRLPMIVEPSVIPSSVYPLEIISLHAMHLHSSVVFRDTSPGKDNTYLDINTGRMRTFHWGCYYCNQVEDEASSIPREEEEKSGVSLHAGNETIFRYPMNSTSSSKVEVMGSGILGLGEEDSFETTWVSLPLPHQVEDLPVRTIDGREHYLILLGNRMVLGFGDNMHGQLALDDSFDVVLSPTTVIQVGDKVKCPPLPYSSSTSTSHTNNTSTNTSSDTLWTVESICDMACGLRHSVFVVEVRPST
ncbi:chromatin binding protein [Trypanosoma theileri]|uniref:Chromatin binding protein n=1 Tax=Trypanosoma theileri TaxID=67003 RepID=A0A1X0NV79_9TRYP|nr:chromatin binding protein [Trypanosoma theileri]ORC88572.1 chromatin binding protein [Trypanosoma theileri]